MLRIGRENEIELTRGDTAYLTVPITDEATGEAYIMDSADVPKYAGETTVTPKVENETVLPTRDKIVKDDITVLKIPQFEVSNTSGGYTLIIGEEYYNNGN